VSISVIEVTGRIVANELVSVPDTVRTTGVIAVPIIIGAVSAVIAAVVKFVPIAVMHSATTVVGPAAALHQHEAC
jgi:hypothetical protein